MNLITARGYDDSFDFRPRDVHANADEGRFSGPHFDNAVGVFVT